MLKFVSVLSSVVMLNFLFAFSSTGSSQSEEVDLSFSKSAVAIESGQPVYNEGTKIWISNPMKKEINIYLNEEVKKLNASKVELSQITKLQEGTYTLVINTNQEEKTFGFTIQ